MNLNLSVATIYDIEPIEELLKEYMAESTYNGLTYCKDGTVNMILSWLNEGFFFIVKDGEKVVGLAVMALMKTFYKELEADVDMFFIHPDYRGTGASRMLVDNIVQNAEANNCKVIYTACLSGISDKNNKLYKNLWGKFGFRELGTVLIRS